MDNLSNEFQTNCNYLVNNHRFIPLFSTLKHEVSMTKSQFIVLPYLRKFYDINFTKYDEIHSFAKQTDKE